MRRALAAAVALACAVPGVARAEEALYSSRPKSYESPQNFAIEGRATLYRPEIDSEPSLAGATPFADTFRDVRRPMPGIELDWQAFRIPHVGTIGPGFGVSYASYSSKALIRGTTVASEESTSLTLVPMHLSAVLRVDAFAREIGIPLVPYVKGGLGLGLWFSTTDTGLARTRDANANVTSTGRGATWGLHAAIGAMFLLDVLDRSAARGFDESLGVNHTYIFGELTRLHLEGLGQTNALRVGDTAFSLGMAFEF